TFASTAAVVCHRGAIPILVDCDPETANIDLRDATRKLAQLRAGKLPEAFPRALPVVGIIPVHVGGFLINVQALHTFAALHRLWIVEDATHALPAAWRPDAGAPWQRCGERTAAVSCFSFYANKPITTGEGGMAVTPDEKLAERMRSMSLLGLSRDAWGRYSGGGSWDYQIRAPGFKYNLTDIAAAIGIHQLARAGDMRRRRELIALQYREALANLEQVELPPDSRDRIHSWHLFPIRLRTERLAITRNEFFEELRQAGIGCSVHWRPLHLHPFYQADFGWRPEHCPVATALWERLISLPIFPAMTGEEIEYVIDTVKQICTRYGR
ncbi:MAG: DegT/DnrJ/EryC1/StrS family aminotransferase, partial [Planctomycetes bacterium]|nr:DegT/DnrJ/EryC1/StrS family aminotransferase [Planctomycetota bacterium]